MLLDRYDFYDMHAVLVAIRSKSCAEYNAKIIGAVKNVLEKQQETNCIEPNIIRNAIKNIENIDKELFYWVYVDNVYTYGHRIEKDMFYYNYLLTAFRLLLSCAETTDYDRLCDLADAFHNIPIFIADGCKKFKKSVKKQFSFYNKKYKIDLWQELNQ